MDAAPSLLPFELANIAIKKLRQHPNQRTAAHALSGRLSVEILAVDPSAVVGLAEDTGLTAYDASYLWLARELRANLITLGEALRAASSS